MAKQMMTLKAFAALHNVSRVTANKWKNRGYIVRDANGLVDVERSNELLADRAEIYRGGRIGGNAAKGDGEKSLSVARSTEIKETYLALSAQLKYERAAGRLCEIDAVRDVIEADYAAVRKRVMRVGGDIAEALAACSNAEMCKSIIDGEIIKVLAELTDDSAYQGDRPH